MIYTDSWNADQLWKLQFGTLVGTYPLRILVAMHTFQYAAQLVSTVPES
jgi:hypothetical protein